ncbi:hypothetical protein IM660_13445 [Ruania alkalisoli]|uniref:Uncharacterized protein n=1 Tax=Ruania alkalisoli TaxID=2779775 RepID=A0A7M1SQ52_9MICO|nr:hypothetical protein [Ruania alkalisoli]QOR69670.1 hypothetical protein IM660_13445 [Ruania alkalisoli]
MTTDPSSRQPSDAPPPPISPQRGGRGALGVILAVVGGVVVLAGLIVGAILLIDADDDPIPTTAPTSSEASEPTPTPSTAETSGSGELLELLTAEADVIVASDGTAWLLEGGWVDASELSDQSQEAYSGTFTSEVGTVTLTALSFDGEDPAADYLAGVRADRGDPDYEGSVWEDGSGTRIDYAGAEDYDIFWYDEAAIVFQATGPEGSVEDFYGSLPF